MALGGGTWVTQNKTLPGAYINVVSTARATATIGERGLVAIALPLGDTDNASTTSGTVLEVTAKDFYNKQAELFPTAPESTMLALRELFKNATKVFIYDTYYDTSGGSKPTVAQICAALEPYEFNIMACYTKEQTDITSYVTQIKSWRYETGKKVQGVVYNATTAPDSEAIINVVDTVSDDDVEEQVLVAWVAGAEAGCAVNASCTNKIYDGELSVVCTHTQTQLATLIDEGKFAFHLVYGDVRVLEDINSLTTTNEDKGDDFKSNQTMRVVDQIANDIAKLFNTKYLGAIPNDPDGRASLWGDIVKHHKELETMRAIENFDSELVTVEPGETKKSIVVNDAVTPLNAMAQLYMTVVVQ